MITIRAFYPKQSAICMDLNPNPESNSENEIDEIQQKKLKMCSDITLALLYLLQTNQSYKELIYNNLYKDISSEKNIILNIKMTFLTYDCHFHITFNCKFSNFKIKIYFCYYFQNYYL